MWPTLRFFTKPQPLAGVTDACALLPETWSWAVTLDEYAEITAANCSALPSGQLQQFNDMRAVVDPVGLIDIRLLAWVDVINSAVWLLVVLVLEIDVRLQEHNRLEGLALTASNSAKFVLYSILAAGGDLLGTTRAILSISGTPSSGWSRLSSSN